MRIVGLIYLVLFVDCYRSSSVSGGSYICRCC